MGLPVQLIWANGAECGEDSIDDGEVDVVTEIDPNAHEKGEIRDCKWMIEVVEGFRCLYLVSSAQKHL